MRTGQDARRCASEGPRLFLSRLWMLTSLQTELLFIIVLISLAQIPLSRFGKEIPNLREGGSSHCENGSPQMQL